MCVVGWEGDGLKILSCSMNFTGIIKLRSLTREVITRTRMRGDIKS